METNKIVTAFLTAILITAFAGFVASQLVKPEKLSENAYKIPAADAPAATGAAPAAGTPEKETPFKTLLAEADPAKGEKISKICGACHTFGKGEPPRIGPNLFGVVGRERGSTAFAYSPAMKAAGGTWTEEKISEFITDPSKVIPGTKMTFVGLKKAEDRAAVIKWLSTKK